MPTVLINGIRYAPVPPARRGPESRLPLGAVLRQGRKALDWTLDAAARETGLSKTFLSELENGHREPSLRTAARLARAYGIDIAYLASSLDVSE